MARRALLALPLLAGMAACAAPGQDCPVPGQARWWRIELQFGRAINGRPPVTEAEWAVFAAAEITPRFPRGFTVIDTQGQWRAPDGALVREAGKLVRIDVPPSPAAADAARAIASAYRARFFQDSVGISTVPVCAAY